MGIGKTPYGKGPNVAGRSHWGVKNLEKMKGGAVRVFSCKQTACACKNGQTCVRKQLILVWPRWVQGWDPAGNMEHTSGEIMGAHQLPEPHHVGPALGLIS